jgi:hypothetical protein
MDGADLERDGVRIRVYLAQRPPAREVMPGVLSARQLGELTAGEGMREAIVALRG